MVDIPSTTAALITTAAQSPSAGTALTPVQVTVTDISQALQNLTRTIQTNATPVTVSDNGTSVTLTTAMGSVTVALAQQLSIAEKQNLTQQLLNLVQAQKPLTLSLQPGSPPTQGVLLVPTSALTPTSTTSPPQQTVQALPSAPLIVGEQLPAVVLSNLSIPPQPTTLNSQLPQNINVPATANLASNATILPSLSVAPPSTLTPTPASPVPTSSPFVSVSLTNAAALPANPATVQNGLPAVISPNIITPASVAPAVIPPPAMTSVPPNGVPTPSFSSGPAISAAPSTATSQPVATSLLQPGNELTLRVDSVLTPTQSATPPTLAPNQIMTTVMTTSPNGNLVLKAGDATLFVKAPVSVPVGTNVIVSVDTVKDALPLILKQVEQSNFPALPQAMAALAQASPQMLAQIMTTSIPQPTDALSGTLMLLFNAFRQGNLRSWLGDDATDTLIRLGKMDIVSSLSRNLSEAGQPAQDTVVGDWRSYPIPLYAQNQFQALTLHVHNDRDAKHSDSDEAASPNSVRFLIDMKLSKLGALQVDGFVQQKKLDMILRSENNLPDGLHNELRGAYIRAMGAVGYQGTINFQIGRRYWMTMQQPAATGIIT